VDPALWNRPEFAANQQNPLFAGLANSVKGIRELGVSVSFLEDSLGMEICVNCKDTQSALGLWTVAQGGLGMAQLAMSQEGSQAPAILNRVKTQAVEKNVFVRVEVLPSDIDEFAGQLLPPASTVNEESKKAHSPKNGPEQMKGKKAPAIKTQLVNGQKFELSDHKGKVVILDFWASWCGPCVQGLPIMQKVCSSFDQEKVRFVAVNQGENKKTINKFLKNKNLTELTVALDKTSSVGDSFMVKGIPQTVVIDQDGIVRFVHVGFGPDSGSQLKNEITELLSEK
jgi:thiol-disulfide isomerase/thioredoxin